MEKEGYSKKKEILKFLVITLIFLIVLVIVYYLVIYTKSCDTKECFAKALGDCKKATWVNDAEEAAWLYTIQGQNNNNCGIEVKLLTIKKGAAELGNLEGESMDCYLPIGIVDSPEKDLSKCTGKLKEDLQDLIIKRMHSYILENLGKVGEELTKPL